jgi:hypothetical protein
VKAQMKKTNKPHAPKGGVKKDLRVTVKPKTQTQSMEFTISEDRKKSVVKTPKLKSIEEPIKKKKKKPIVVDELDDVEDYSEPSTALVPVSVTLPKAPLDLKNISKLKTKGMRSIIGDSAEDIQQLLEVGDNDNATALMLKRMLQALVDLVPYAEHNVRKSKGQRGVYQINSLISSIRELMIDLQSAQDRGAIGEALNEKVLRPAFLDVAMELVKETAMLSSDVKDLLSVEDYNNKFRPLVLAQRTRIGQFVQKRYEEAATATKQFMQR